MDELPDLPARTEPTDADLLRRYVDDRSDDAFATLVRRHLNLVYATALRQSRNATQAEEIAQTVFVILARKASTLTPATCLPAWLHQTTRFTSTTLSRSELRRARREQEAQLSQPQNVPHPANADADEWETLAPALDAAIGELNAEDRRAIVLRFLQGCTLKEVAAALAATEDAAKKRVTRAVEKLRRQLQRRGLLISGSALIALLSAHAVTAAPTAVLSITLSATTLTAATTSPGTTALTEATLHLMAWTKTKVIVGAAAALIITTSATTVVLTSTLRAPPTPPPEKSDATPVPSARIFTQGLNQAHRRPGALYIHADGDDATRQYLEKLLAQIRRDLDPAESIKRASAVTGDDLTNRTLYLYGTLTDHALLRRLNDQLPIRFEPDGVIVGRQKCVGRDVGAIFACPNPFNAEHRLVVYGAVSSDGLQDINAVFHGPTDYVVFNRTTRRLEKQGQEPSRCALLVGAFDRSDPSAWTVVPQLQLPALPAVEAATQGAIVPVSPDQATR